jgi:hypothetical protein
MQGRRHQPGHCNFRIHSRPRKPGLDQDRRRPGRIALSFARNRDYLWAGRIRTAMNTDPLTPPSVHSPRAEAPQDSSVTPSAVEFQPLDPRVIKLWRFRQCVTSAVLLSGGLVAVVFIGFTAEAWLWAWLGWGALLLLRIFLWVWYPPRAYRGWGYRMDGRVLETKEGVWFREITLLPLSRLQHVDLHSGPIQRSLGLASLLLHTAGTHHATLVIPGLEAEAAARLRDQLVAVGGDDAV